jgi:glycerol-3-phosphate acyltransferase PlsX
LSAPIIAIDAMGGDFGPHCIVPASLHCLAEVPSLHLALVGPSSILEEIIARRPGVDRARLTIVDADEVIGMDERPTQALRSKPRSSMRVALELVRDGQAQACVSAGNTGALMALARHVLKTLPGVDRPAMMTAIPTIEGACLLLDLGANVDCTAEQLYQFAVMGSVAAQSLGIEQPRVSLLNVGTEEIKGNQQVKAAAALLQQAGDINYRGFVEGDGLFRGETDVAVCDGFVGNILLKSSEGLAHLVALRVEALFRRSLISRLVGALALPLLRQLRADLRPAQYNGASFLGLQGIVVKSHGSAGAEGFRSAILRATQDVEHNLPERLHSRLEHLLVTNRSVKGAADVTTSNGSPSN